MSDECLDSYRAEVTRLRDDIAELENENARLKGRLMAGLSELKTIRHHEPGRVAVVRQALLEGR